jgi:hypothetical protein
MGRKAPFMAKEAEHCPQRGGEKGGEVLKKNLGQEGLDSSSTSSPGAWEEIEISRMDATNPLRGLRVPRRGEVTPEQATALGTATAVMCIVISLVVAASIMLVSYPIFC